jgi:Creatinase/Prolidase N-terminal domain
MKRGLVLAADDSTDVYTARLDRLRARLREAGADAALVYGDVYRSDDIAYLTNLCIYWNEGTIAVPLDGPPALLAKLSARVHTWMRRTSVLEDLRASQKLPELIADYLREISASTVALVDRTWWPSDLVDGIAGAATGVTLIDLPDGVRDTRPAPDPAELADLQQAGALVGRALEAARAADAGDDGHGPLAAIEQAARGGGARDVLAAVTDEVERTQLQVTVQYGNAWASAARVAPEPPAQLRDAQERALAGVAAGITSDDLARAVPGAEARVVDHRDLATAGDYRSAQDGAVPLTAGAVVCIAVSVDGLTLADTVRITTEGAVSLTEAHAEVDA